MLESLRRLRQEIDSIRSKLLGVRGVYTRDEEILARIHDLFLTWSTSVRPPIAASGVSSDVLGVADAVFSNLVRLTSSRSRRQQYLRLLLSARRVLVQQVLLEVAKVSARAPIPARPTAVRDLIPEIPDVGNELIPRALYGWIPQMQSFLRQYSFDRNVFIMVAYRTSLAKLIKRIRGTLEGQRLNAVVARDHPLTDDLYNPIACLLCCNFGIAIFDRPEPRQTHNANVIYELAVMHILKRPLLILKHASVKAMPSDFLHKLYEKYESVDEAAEIVRGWAAGLTHETG